MMLEDMVTLIEDEDLAATGKTLFIDRMPATIPKAVLLRQTGIGTSINHYLPGYFKARFQLIVRDDDKALGTQLALDISAALTKNETLLDSIFVKYVRPSTLPVCFPVNDGDLIETSVNFDICYCDNPV